MQCPHWPIPTDSHGTSRGSQRYRCRACRRIFKLYVEVKTQLLSNMPDSFILNGDASHRQSSRDPSQTVFAGCKAAHTPAVPPPTKVCLHEIDNSTFIAKKILMLALASGRLYFCKERSFVEKGRSKLQVLWQQMNHLPTMGYGTDMLKSHENIIPHAKHYGNHLTTQSTQLPTTYYLTRLHQNALLQ